jgi:hypothetical protein
MSMGSCAHGQPCCWQGSSVRLQRRQAGAVTHLAGDAQRVAQLRLPCAKLACVGPRAFARGDTQLQALLHQASWSHAPYISVMDPVSRPPAGQLSVKGEYGKRSLQAGSSSGLRRAPAGAAPSSTVSNSLQPVVICTMSPRCSATTVAVVKPMGTTFHAVPQQRRYVARAALPAPWQRSTLAWRRGSRARALGLHLGHLCLADALDSAQLFLGGVRQGLHGVDAALLELLYVCSGHPELLREHARAGTRAAGAACAARGPGLRRPTCSFSMGYGPGCSCASSATCRPCTSPAVSCTACMTALVRARQSRALFQSGAERWLQLTGATTSCELLSEISLVWPVRSCPGFLQGRARVRIRACPQP